MVPPRRLTSAALGVKTMKVSVKVLMTGAVFGCVFLLAHSQAGAQPSEEAFAQALDRLSPYEIGAALRGPHGD